MGFKSAVPEERERCWVTSCSEKLGVASLRYSYWTGNSVGSELPGRFQPSLKHDAPPARRRTNQEVTLPVTGVHKRGGGAPPFCQQQPKKCRHFQVLGDARWHPEPFTAASSLMTLFYHHHHHPQPSFPAPALENKEEVGQNGRLFSQKLLAEPHIKVVFAVKEYIFRLFSRRFIFFV